MEPIGTFGVVAFNQSSHIGSVLARIQAWSDKTGVAVFFHPLLASREIGRAHV